MKSSTWVGFHGLGCICGLCRVMGCQVVCLGKWDRLDGYVVSVRILFTIVLTIVLTIMLTMSSCLCPLAHVPHTTTPTPTGEEKRNGEVIVEEGHKWSNEEYFRLTGLKEYAPYMFGGGYIFSMDVAKALVQVNRLAPLKFMPNEDSTFGFWVMGMDLRKIDHPKVRTAAGHCCYTAQLDDPTAGRWRRFAMRGIENVCAGWLILHKVDTDDQMRCVAVVGVVMG